MFKMLILVFTLFDQKCFLLHFGFVGYSSVEKFKRVRERESKRRKESEAKQYNPDRFDCRVYPVIPLVHGNMCWTCVCTSQVTAQSGRQRENERRAAWLAQQTHPHL